MNNPLNLYPHNLEGYYDTRQAFDRGMRIVSNVRGTGTGKSFINLQLLLDNQDKKIIYVVPSLAILEHLQEIIDENKNVHAADFSHVDFRTYQSFINMSDEEIKQLECDFLIVDELHHLNGPVWGSRILRIIETHPKMKVFGTTAYTVVNRGTSYERDMVLDGGEEIFSNSVVNRYDICDAMIDGVLPLVIYKGACINLESNLEDVLKNLDSTSLTLGEYRKYQLLLKDLKRRIHGSLTVADLLKKNLKPNGKYYYFCPTHSQKKVNDIETIKAQILGYLKGKYKEEDIVFYTTTSEMGKLGKKNRDAFYHDKTLDGVDCSNKLRIMFAINQYNEGVHAPNVDGVIEGRMTNSDIVFFEHIGRCLSVKGDTTKRYKELEKFTTKELMKMCQDREIPVRNNSSREALIRKLLAPVIIDLTGNYRFIKKLEDNLKNRLKELPKRKNGSYQRGLILDASFDIEVENIDIFNVLMGVKERLNASWDRMYEYARLYHDHHGHLEVPASFKTNNGFESDESGKVNLGRWIADQRQKVIPESERGQLLSKIGMRFEKLAEQEWREKYEYARLYHDYHGHLEVPTSFKTNNGFESDENGKVNLGRWIVDQRRKVTPESERGKLLSKIGMRFEKNYFDQKWQEMYEYARLYHDHHGHLEVPKSFKTNNGFEFDENGKVNLGQWIADQRQKVTPESERGKLLSKIGMRFWKNYLDKKWQEMYEYARLYYDHHGHLEVPASFKTNNGFEYDENGKINLGQWITNQRQKVTPESEKGQLLSKIGMRFEKNYFDQKWQEMYEYAHLYYDHYGNLKVPQGFKTNNGFESDENGKINLGTWISNQRQTVNPESERGKLLSKIGMCFEKNYFDQKWQEMYEYAHLYYDHYGNLKVPQSFKTNNGFETDESGKINLGQWIAKQREAYRGNRSKLSDEQIILLEEIGMIWMPEKTDEKLQNEVITVKNVRKKQLEVLHRMSSLLNHVINREIQSKEDVDKINEQFMDELNRKSR